MPTQDAAKSAPILPTPSQLLGTKALVAGRLQALRDFHHGLDQVDENVRSLLPARRPAPATTPQAEGPASFRFEMRAPWYVESADQPA